MPQTPTQGWASKIAYLAAHHVTWPRVAAAAFFALAFITYRLLAERARRRTIVAILAAAPAGTVVIQKRGPAGPPLRIWVGDGLRPVSATLVIVIARLRRHLSGGSR
jgi:hypothetical protein